MRLSFITKTVTSLAVILIILLLAVYGLIATNTGARITLDLAKHFIPGTLSYNKVSGRIIDKLNLTEMTYQNQDFSLTAKTAKINWNLQKAFAGKIVINQLDAKTVTLAVNNKTYHLKQLTLSGYNVRQEFYFKAQASLLNGKINADGQLNFSPELGWSITGTADKLQTKEFSTEWPATVNFDFASQGQYKNYAIQITKLNGTIEQQIISGEIKMALAGSLLTKLDLNLHAGEASLTATGKITNIWDLTWQANIPKLGLIAENAGGSLISTGHISGNLKQPNIQAKISANNLVYQSNQFEKLTADINFNLFNGKTSTVNAKIENAKFDGLSVKQLNLNGSGNQTKQALTLDATTATTKLSAKLTTEVKANGFSGVFTANIPDQPTLNATFLLPNYQLNQLPNKNQTLSGKINWQSTDLSFLKHLYPDIIKPTGQLDLNTTISGTLSKPLINGKLMLKNARVVLPARQITVSNINITANFDANKVVYTGELSSGEKITIAGETALEKNFPTTLTIKGQNFLASNSHEFKLYLSPDLTIKSTSQRIDVTGDVAVPKAMIAPHEFASTEELPDDVVFVDQESTIKKEKPEPPIGLYTNINLIAGDDVQINVKGLKGRLTGKVNLQSTPTTTTIATGQLNIIDGEFRSRGAELKVEQGQLIFTNSPITDPAINVRATKTIKTTTSTFTILQENIIVGIAITGRVKNPKIKLFSEPPGLSQADILSYIVLGQPLGSASKSSLSVLMTAASALDVGSDNGGITKVIGNIKSAFGLSEIGFQTGSTYSPETDDISQNTSLVLGKYLSPKLYVQYSIGLIEPINTIRLNYSLSKKMVHTN